MIRTKLMQPRARVEPRLQGRLGSLQGENALPGQDGKKSSQPHQNGAHPQSIKQSEPPTTHTRLFDAAPPFKEIKRRCLEPRFHRSEDPYWIARVVRFLCF
mgnify:FL=1